MSEITDERQSNTDDQKQPLTPEETLTLAQLEQRLLTARGNASPGTSPTRPKTPTFSEGFSRVSPSAQIVR